MCEQTNIIKAKITPSCYLTHTLQTFELILMKIRLDIPK